MSDWLEGVFHKPNPAADENIGRAVVKVMMPLSSAPVATLWLITPFLDSVGKIP